MSKDLKVFHWNGNIYFFDPDIQLPDCPHTFLWNSEKQEIDTYATASIRSEIESTTNDLSPLNEQLHNYAKWKTTGFPMWRETILPDYEKRRQEDKVLLTKQKEKEKNKTLLLAASKLVSFKLAERHMEHLIKSGKEYAGLRSHTGGWHRRVTHCYSCLASLDNSTDVECVACGWIVCTCGACGCGYGGM